MQIYNENIHNARQFSVDISWCQSYAHILISSSNISSTFRMIATWVILFFFIFMAAADRNSLKGTLKNFTVSVFVSRVP